MFVCIILHFFSLFEKKNPIASVKKNPHEFHIYIYLFFNQHYLFVDCTDKYDCTSWIGGNDIETEGQFVWGHSKTPFTYMNWDPDNPNDYEHEIKIRDCVDIFYNGQWNDRLCDALANFICEK